MASVCCLLLVCSTAQPPAAQVLIWNPSGDFAQGADSLLCLDNGSEKLYLIDNEPCAQSNARTPDNKTHCEGLAQSVLRSRLDIAIASAQAAQLRSDVAPSYPGGCWLRMDSPEVPGGQMAPTQPSLAPSVPSQSPTTAAPSPMTALPGIAGKVNVSSSSTARLTETAASTVAAIAALGSLNPMAATQAGRLKLMMKMARCPPDTDAQELDFLDSPTGVGRRSRHTNHSPSQTQENTQYRTVLLSNLGVVGGLVLLHYAVCVVHNVLRNHTNLLSRRMPIATIAPSAPAPVYAAVDNDISEPFLSQTIACDRTNSRASSRISGKYGDNEDSEKPAERCMSSPSVKSAEGMSVEPSETGLSSGGQRDRRHTSFQKSMAIMRFPSFAVLPFLILFQPLATPSFQLVYYSHNVSDKMLAICCVSLLLGLLAYIARRLRSASFRCILVDNSESDLRSPVMSWLLGRVHWSSQHLDNDIFERRFSLLFTNFTMQCRWYIVLDVLTLCLISIVGAVVPHTKTQCACQAVAMIVIELLFLAVVLNKMPFIAPLDHWHSIAIVVFQVGGLGFALVSVYYEEAWIATTSRVLLLTSTLLVLLKGVFDIVIFLRDRRIKMRHDAQRKAQLNNDLSTAGDTNLSFVRILSESSHNDTHTPLTPRLTPRRAKPSPLTCTSPVDGKTGNQESASSSESHEVREDTKPERAAAVKSPIRRRAQTTRTPLSCSVAPLAWTASVNSDEFATLTSPAGTTGLPRVRLRADTALRHINTGVLSPASLELRSPLRRRSFGEDSLSLSMSMPYNSRRRRSSNEHGASVGNVSPITEGCRSPAWGQVRDDVAKRVSRPASHSDTASFESPMPLSPKTVSSPSFSQRRSLKKFGR